MSDTSLLMRLAPFVVTAGYAEAKIQAQSSFLAGFLNSIGVVFATELGDKTFFVAAILATKYDLPIVYAGCWGALAVMTLVSAIMGALVPALIGSLLPFGNKILKIPPMLLLLYNGGEMIYDALKDMTEGKSDNEGMREEFGEAETEIEERLAGFQGNEEAENTESRNQLSFDLDFEKLLTQKNLILFQEFFTMTFLAEWGDKSQIATVAMSSTANPIGVAAGGILGHAACTGIAVATGHFITEQKIVTEAQISLIGGLLFVAFALHTLITLL